MHGAGGRARAGRDRQRRAAALFHRLRRHAGRIALGRACRSLLSRVALSPHADAGAGRETVGNRGGHGRHLSHAEGFGFGSVQRRSRAPGAAIGRHYGGVSRRANRVLGRHGPHGRPWRVIRFFTWTREQMTRLAAGFLPGTLLGALGATLALGMRLEALSMENASLADRLADLEDKYQRLLQQPASRLQAKDVVVHLVDFRGDERTELELRRFVRDLVKDHVIGRPVQEIDHLLIQKVIDGRRITVENRDWHLRAVMSSITWETYFLYVEATATLPV